MKFTEYLMSTVKLGMLFLLVTCVSGCMGNKGTVPPETQSTEAVTQEKSKTTTAVYYDFEDILVPLELKVNKDRTIVVSTPGYRSGILALKGRVDSSSLFNFFGSNMLKDNWSVVSKIKSPGTIIMVFEKPTKCAVITIRDSQVYTYVEIGVAPTVGNQGGEMIQTDLAE